MYVCQVFNSKLIFLRLWEIKMYIWIVIKKIDFLFSVSGNNLVFLEVVVNKLDVRIGCQTCI